MIATSLNPQVYAFCSTCNDRLPILDADWRLGDPYCPGCATAWDADHAAHDARTRADRAADAVLDRLGRLGVVGTAEMREAVADVLTAYLS